MSNIRDVFAPIESDPRWFNPGGLSNEILEGLEADIGRSMPPEMKDLLRYTTSSEWAGDRLVQFFDEQALVDVNTRLTSGDFEGAFAFASDGGPSWYIVDANDELGRGEGAVWEIPAGAPFPEEARYVAEDIPGFIQWMIEGG